MTKSKSEKHMSKIIDAVFDSRELKYKGQRVRKVYARTLDQEGKCEILLSGSQTTDIVDILKIRII